MKKATGAHTTNDDIDRERETIDLERLVAVERAAAELISWTQTSAPEQLPILGEADYEEERSRRMERLAQALHGGIKFLDVFGIDEAGVYHPPSRDRYLQWEDKYARAVGLLIRFADVIEALDRRMPPSATCGYEIDAETKRDLANLVLGLPAGWRREVIKLRAERDAQECL